MDDVLNQNNQDFTDELKNVIASSPLSQEDKDLWVSALQNAPEDVVFSMLSYFQEFPDKMGWATQTLRRKIEAMKHNDMNAWQEILAEEEAELANMVHAENT